MCPECTLLLPNEISFIPQPSRTNAVIPLRMANLGRIQIGIIPHLPFIPLFPGLFREAHMFRDLFRRLDMGSQPIGTRNNLYCLFEMDHVEPKFLEWLF